MPIVLVLLALTATLPRDLAPFGPAAQAFLADPALVPFAGELRAGSSTARSPREQPPAQFSLSQPPFDPGRLTLARASYRVSQYDAGRPAGPVTDAVLPDDQLEGVALEFAQRHVPELFEGGERLRTVSDGTGRLGDRRFRYQLVETGVRLPIAVEVGVRVFDGKVAWYDLYRPPCDPPPAPVLDVEAAKAVVTRNTSGSEHATATWLEAYLEYLPQGSSWHTAWCFTVEWQRSDDRRPEFSELVQKWAIDAVDGRVVQSEQVKLDKGRFQWYRRLGGQHLTHSSWMRPELALVDSDPRWSPDAKQILFLSTRARPGWPTWLGRGPGVFVVNADGSSVRCLLPEPSVDARWSLDGRSIVVSQREAVVLVELATGAQTRFTAAREWPYLRAERLADGRVVAFACRHMIEYRLCFLDPLHPDDPAPELRPWGERRTLLGDFRAEPEGGLLMTVGTDVRMVGTNDPLRSKGPWSLYRLQPAVADTTPETVAEYVTAASRLGPAPGGRLLLGRGQRNWDLFDPATGAAAPWEVERVGVHPTGDTDERIFSSSLRDLTFSPAGDQVLFVYDYWTGELDAPAAQILWLADADGQHAGPLTPPEPRP